MHSSLKAALICLASVVPTLGAAVTLGDFYRLGASDRAWYLGGVCDSNLIDQRNDGTRSQCLEHLGI